MSFDMHAFFSIPWIHEISMWFSLSDAYKGIFKKSVLHYFASFPISCHLHHFTFLSWLLFLNIQVPHYHLLHLDPLNWPFILRTIPCHPWKPPPLPYSQQNMWYFYPSMYEHFICSKYLDYKWNNVFLYYRRYIPRVSSSKWDDWVET